MRPAIRLLAFGLVTSSLVSGARAQDSTVKAEATKDAPPDTIAAPIRATLDAVSVLIYGEDGKPLAKIWLRKGIPASAKPEGAKGTILFPFLKEGELLGALEFVSEGHDYRDQAVPPGVYTLRYGLQPVNGDHLGVSPYRDYALLLPAAIDKSVAPIVRKTLEKQSAESAGSNHPTVLLLAAPPKDAKPEPTTIHDQEKNTWGVVLPASLSVQGESAATPASLELILIGAAMT